ncbi:HHIP-like protein 2 [Pyxicephalus adspersus]
MTSCVDALGCVLLLYLHWKHGKFSKGFFLLSAFTILLHTGVFSHPQCLDSGPPFKPPVHLEFCSIYEEFGCCDQDKDNIIAETYWSVMDNYDYKEQELCGDYVKNILCQECSPYAAHLYDAEDPRTPLRTLPGLCFDYCSDFFYNCHSTIFLLTNDTTIRESAKDMDLFCNLMELPDPDYCFPDVIQNMDLNNNLGAVVEDQEGCLKMCLVEVANGLRNPVLMIHANDGTHRMFIAEQVGIVWVYLPDGGRLEEPFLYLQDSVVSTPWHGDERGFLGMAFHPKFRYNGKFYVYYSILDDEYVEKIRISEFRVSHYDINKADRRTERYILEVVQPSRSHNGGQLLFGTDGYLYIFTGDGGELGDPHGEFGNGQNRSALLGKVLQIDVDGEHAPGKPYRIPKDNPFVSERSAAPEVYAYGCRNMWRCSVDRGDRVTGKGRGRIFCGDVGQSRYEEIDIIVKGGNYGWRAKEGPECFDIMLCLNSSLHDIPPIFFYGHSVGKSVTGGYVYRGCDSPNLNGLYIFGDFMNGRLMALHEDEKTNTWTRQDICMGDNTVCAFPKLINKYTKYIISFAEDEAGELYFLSTSDPTSLSPYGTLYRFVDPSRRAPPGKCKNNPTPVRTRSNVIPFVPRERTVLEILREEMETQQKPAKKPTKPPRPPRPTKTPIKQTTTKKPLTTTFVVPTEPTKVPTVPAITEFNPTERANVSVVITTPLIAQTTIRPTKATKDKTSKTKDKRKKVKLSVNKPTRNTKKPTKHILKKTLPTKLSKRPSKANIYMNIPQATKKAMTVKSRMPPPMKLPKKPTKSDAPMAKNPQTTQLPKVPNKTNLKKPLTTMVPKKPTKGDAPNAKNPPTTQLPNIKNPLSTKVPKKPTSTNTPSLKAKGKKSKRPKVTFNNNREKLGKLKDFKDKTKNHKKKPRMESLEDNNMKVKAKKHNSNTQGEQKD